MSEPTTKWLTLSYIKTHSRIEYDCEDAALELYAIAAEDTVLHQIGMTYDELLAKYGTVPAAIRQASLLLVDASYNYRSPVSPTNMAVVRYNYDMLIKPYMEL